MKVIDMLRNGNGRKISVEIEPPEIGSNINEVFGVLDPIVKAGVRYIDITYHPEDVIGYEPHNGHQIPVTRRKKPGTLGIAGAIKGKYGEYGVEPVPHVICTGFKRTETQEYAVEGGFLGIGTYLAVRGDVPRDHEGRKMPFEPTPGGHSNAIELIEQLDRLRQGKYIGTQDGNGEPLGICIGAACYPEGHPDWKSSFPNGEIGWCQGKKAAGADYFATQMIFDVDKYCSFVDKALKAGIDTPIVPGIKVLTLYRHLSSLHETFGCSIPRELTAQVEKYKDNKEDIRKVGIEWCVKECDNLLTQGAPGLHFYASRKAPVAEVIRALYGDEQTEIPDSPRMSVRQTV